MLATLVLIVMVGVQLGMPSTAAAAVTIDTTGCTGTDLDLGTTTADVPALAGTDCTVGFSTDSGNVQLRLYQQDGAGTAVPGVPDHAAGTNDWGPGEASFGACLRALSAVPTSSWTVPGDTTCDATAGDPWYPIAATSGAPGSVVAQFGTGSFQAMLRFGAQTNATTPAGAAAAPLVIEVIQPVPAPPTNTALPLVSGTTTVGQVVSTTDGTWTGSPSSWAYQWRRCNAAGGACADIGGATANTYTLVAADIDGTVRVVVTATNGDGSTPATSAQTAVIAGIAPTAGTASIAGTTTTGQTLTASTGGVWTAGTPAAGATTWQWRRCNAAGAACTDIGGATASTYALVAADVDSTIRVVASWTNTCTIGCGTASATSTQTAQVAGIAPTAGTASITGVAGKNETLTAGSAGWTTGTPAGTTTWQWRRCNAAGAACADIAGATSSTYVLVTADVDNTIRVVMTVTNSCAVGCGAASATSSQTAVVMAIVNVTTVNTTVNGTSATANVPASAQVGDVLVLIITTRDGTDQNIREQGTTDWTKYGLSAFGAPQWGQTNNSNRMAIAIFYRVVTGTENPSYTYQWTNSRGATATMLSFTGVDNALPIGGFSSVTGTASAQIIPQVTGTDPRSMLVATYTTRTNAGSYSPVSPGLVEILDTNTADTTTAIFTEQFTAGGSTGTRQANGPNSEFAANMIWLNPE